MNSPNPDRFSSGFYSLIAAQFFSGLADNALLIVGIALLTLQGREPWWVPMLKMLSITSFIVMAPWVGVLADRWPKYKVMWVANSLKALACVGLMLSIHPFLAFAMLGFGAALYSPAKYGLITELARPDQLVRANAWIEVSTVLAAVLGVVLGGWLVGAYVQSLAWTWLDWMDGVSSRLLFAFMALLSCYSFAAVLNLRVPHSGVPKREFESHPVKLIQRFICSNAILWQDPLGRFSLSITTLFWGVGASMQLIVLAWAQSTLDLSLERAAYIQGCTAAGVIFGAYLASCWLKLHHAIHIGWLGFLLGGLLPLMLWVDTSHGAMWLMVVVGTVSGFFVVPMNALLQNRGHMLLTAGESIAVQNFSENVGIAVMMSIYSGLLAVEFDMNVLILLLGLTILLVMTLIFRRYYKQPRLHRTFVMNEPC
jgi:MFS transporter, LPLT family, lysophospholipid transporter